MLNWKRNLSSQNLDQAMPQDSKTPEHPTSKKEKKLDSIQNKTRLSKRWNKRKANTGNFLKNRKNNTPTWILCMPLLPWNLWMMFVYSKQLTSILPLIDWWLVSSAVASHREQGLSVKENSKAGGSTSKPLSFPITSSGKTWVLVRLICGSDKSYN